MTSEGRRRTLLGWEASTPSVSIYNKNLNPTQYFGEAVDALEITCLGFNTIQQYSDTANASRYDCAS